MKEFIKNNKITYNLMSFTAFKSLLIFSLLLESPQSYDDIIEYFASHDFIKEKISIDTIRVYLNSLKRAGCQITKTKRAEGGKFILISHPFVLDISEEQTKTITKLCKTLSKTLEIQDLILLEKFLRKISSNIKNNSFKTAIEKISVLSGLEIELLENLLNCCLNKQQIILKYNSPRSGYTDLEIICDKLGFENNKLYIYGTSLDYNQSCYLLVNRIVDIKEIKSEKSQNLNIEEVTIRYTLKSDKQELQLKENEKIINIEQNKILIEAKSSNKFALKQRILSHGNLCTVIEPEDFRQEIISTLKRMRAEY